MKTFLPSIHGHSPSGQVDVPAKALALYALIQSHPGQQRPSMTLHSVLCRVAQARVLDLGVRNYFDHTTPEGIGPNELVKRAGYVLPDLYGRDEDGNLDIRANNVESLDGGQKDADIALDGWLHSKNHRPHVLGEGFYNDQTNIGVGWAESGGKYDRYWCLISAPPEGA